ncbi:MAG: hypothetical protein IPO06_08960 [Leptospiraceae bacterium]|nr:hypothetical protein [Leptospiraceae bacterium]
MIKMISKLLVVFSLCFLVASSLLADDQDFKNKGKSRIIVGLGVQFDPNSLRWNNRKDGLILVKQRQTQTEIMPVSKKAVIAEEQTPNNAKPYRWSYLL